MVFGSCVSSLRLQIKQRRREMGGGRERKGTSKLREAARKVAAAAAAYACGSFSRRKILVDPDNIDISSNT
ncbi:Cdk-activating kinase assembly factor [Quillaja saponaria]|uniref:Cdk-activating kinase assembly factor n=1 Tax=Quillaja saponaria TaxID=32244 RepID=A0AAD7P8X1_QUISA|nr:Cdk-activating kinase assembly factor [Quillaja saponaria]